MAKGTTGTSSEAELHERLDRIQEQVRQLIPVIEAAADARGTATPKLRRRNSHSEPSRR